MKYSRWILLAVLLVASVDSFANSSNYYQSNNLNAILYFQPNYGFGDNFGGSVFGPGVNLGIAGGTSATWTDAIGFAPGTVLGGTTPVDWDTVWGNVGSQSADNWVIFASSLTVGYFTLPTNGQMHYSVVVPAWLGGLTLWGCGNNGCQVIGLGTASGKFTINFVYYPSQGLYYATNGVFSTVPEPGTLSLVAIGAAVTAWRKRRQCKTS
jgi:hypothetical protein